MRVWLVSNLLGLFFFFVPFFDSPFYFRLGIRSAATRRQSSGRHHLRHDVLLLFGQVSFIFLLLFSLLFGRHSNQESWSIFLFGLLAMRRHKFVIFQSGFSRIFFFFEIIRKANDLVAQQQQQLGTSSK